MTGKIYHRTAAFIKSGFTKQKKQYDEIEGVSLTTVYSWLRGASVPRKRNVINALAKSLYDSSEDQSQFIQQLEVISGREDSGEFIDLREALVNGSEKFNPGLVISPIQIQSESGFTPLEEFCDWLTKEVVYQAGVLDNNSLDISYLYGKELINNVYSTEELHAALPVLLTPDKLLYCTAFETPIFVPINAVYSKMELDRKYGNKKIEIIQMAMMNRQFEVYEKAQVSEQKVGTPDDIIKPICIRGDLGESHVISYLGLKKGMYILVKTNNPETNTHKIEKELIKITDQVEPIPVFISDELTCCELIKQSDEDLALLFPVDDDEKVFPQGYSINRGADQGAPYLTHTEQFWYNAGMVTSIKHAQWSQSLETILEFFMKSNFPIIIKGYVDLYMKYLDHFDGIVSPYRIRSWLNLEGPVKHENWGPIIEAVKDELGLSTSRGSPKK